MAAAAPLLLLVSIAARLAWTYLVPNGANFVDLHVYVGGAGTLGDHGMLYDYVYADQTPDFPLPFTYPPFAAVVFYPLHLLPFGSSRSRGSWASSPRCTAWCASANGCCR